MSSSMDCSSVGSIMMTSQQRARPGYLRGQGRAERLPGGFDSDSGSVDDLGPEGQRLVDAGRSLIGICSSSRPCRTRCTSASESSDGVSSSTADGLSFARLRSGPGRPRG